MATPSLARAEESATHPFVLSTAGPGADRGAVALGLGATLFVTSVDVVSIDESARVSTSSIQLVTALPTLAVTYAYGIASRVDFVLSGYLSALPPGVLAQLRPMLQVRPTPPESPLHVGFRLAPELLVFARGEALVAFGVAPGLSLGFGNRKVQVSALLDVPTTLVAATSGDGSAGARVSPALRPAVVVEGAVTRSLGLFLKGEALMLPGGGQRLTFTTGITP